MSKYEIYDPMNGTDKQDIYVIEIDIPVLAYRRCVGESYKVKTIRSPLVAAYWRTGHRVWRNGKTNKSAKVKALKAADKLIEELEAGIGREPDWKKGEPRNAYRRRKTESAPQSDQSTVSDAIR